MRNLTILPLLLSPEKDEELLRTTEGRISTFAHDLVPDYLRTKPEPSAEQKMMQLENKAANLTYDASQVDSSLFFILAYLWEFLAKLFYYFCFVTIYFQKQVAQYNKVVTHVWDISNKAREEWEGEAGARASQVQTSSAADTHTLVAAVGMGKGLKVITDFCVTYSDQSICFL